MIFPYSWRKSVLEWRIKAVFMHDVIFPIKFTLEYLTLVVTTNPHNKKKQSNSGFRVCSQTLDHDGNFI